MKTLTDEQKRAIDLPLGNLQLIACAGSGKTEVVARRVAKLLRPGPEALLPRNIIAFTFTEKAAAELKERIVETCRREIGVVTGLAEMYVGTIHGFALELLKSEAPKYLKFEVLNEVQQALFVDRHSKASGLTTTTELNGEPLKRYVSTNLYVSALSILRESVRVEKPLAGSSMMEGLEKYEKLIDEKSYLDYSGILASAVEVMTNDQDVRKRLAERVRHVIVDEYQDVNPIQEALIWLLNDLGASLCVVGDDDQTIYQWRGSEVRNIVRFAERYKDVTRVRLEENFRSSTGIVETARAFIAKNGVRLPKEMKPTGAQPDDAGDLIALSFESDVEEARYVAETIRSLRGVAFKDGDQERGLALSDMAILLRTVKGSGEAITTALRDAGIRYVVGGMNNLFDRVEVEAARQLFYFMAGRIQQQELKQAWERAGVGAGGAKLEKAIRKASEARAAMAEEGGERYSFYSIQRQFLTFLEDAEIREERVPDNGGEVVFYNLGKFSQLISDFETIHYHSKPTEKYEAFAGFLEYRAAAAYPEGWQDNQYANPNAVRVMTIHQAKGMQWPVVFVPGLTKNRFPMKKHSGKSVWHILPKEGIEGQERFEGTIEDERRLFYVAMTRAQKFLHMTWAPVEGNRLYQRASEFWENVLESKWVKRRQPDYSKRKRLPEQPRASVANVVLSFSDLKYFFECPYQFKLRILYGFNAPIHEALGYGKSLHDVLAEVHSRALNNGTVPATGEVPALVERHLHTPYAYPKLREQLTASAEKVVANYLKDNQEELKTIEFFEKPVEISLGDGVSVVGRIDLVRRPQTNETTIVDLKSTDRAQSEEVTETQLHVYALGYQELTGRRPEKVEIYNLDERKKKPRSVDDEFLAEVRDSVKEAAEALRTNQMPMRPTSKKCLACDYRGVCLEGAKVAANAGKSTKR